MDLVTVAQFPTSAEAAIVRNRLLEDGIDAVLADDATGDLFHLAADFGEVKVQVPTDQEERAREILAKIHHTPPSDDNGNEEA